MNSHVSQEYLAVTLSKSLQQPQARVVILRSRRFSAAPKDLNRSTVQLNVERESNVALKTLKLLLLRPVRRAHVLMAQIPQHLLVFFAHSARKVWIIQVPVARRLRHVL